MTETAPATTLAPACDDLDGCGAAAGQPCDPTCPSAASLENDALLDRL